jgi:hypothetical protein
MGMIKCADCGGDISSNAESCLHCGSKKFDNKKNHAKKQANKMGWVGFIVGYLFGVLTLWSIVTKIGMFPPDGVVLTVGLSLVPGVVLALILNWFTEARLSR